jgi:thiol-disulfide isomerase/thioredoxin
MVPTPTNNDNRPGPTPVPPRGGKRKPNRPPAKRAGGTGSGGSVGVRPAVKDRPADNRRAAMARKRRRNQTSLAVGAIVVVIAVVAVIIGIKAAGGGTKSDTAAAAVPASTLSALTSSVSPQTLKAAATNYNLPSADGPTYGSYPTVTTDTPITTSGKPEVLYIGAEFCPFCATERWAMVLALSEFGTFHNLTSIHSSATDEFPNTPTFSFYNSTYTSPYLTFVPVETETVNEKPLQNPTAAQEALAEKYDPGSDGPPIPFVYFNGKAIISGAEWNPQLLAGKSFQQVVSSIEGGTSTLASSVDADAGAIVSMICRMTGGKGPAGVCSLFPKPITSFAA